MALDFLLHLNQPTSLGLGVCAAHPVKALVSRGLDRRGVLERHNLER